MVCARCAADQDIAHGMALVECDQMDVTRACAFCGAPLPVRGARGAGAIVESTAARGPVSTELPAGMTGGERSTDLVVVRPSLPALLWRQPAVRTVARAGAGAVALTLGMRLLRGWLARGPIRARRMGQAARSALPLAHQLLDQSGDSVERLARGDEVVETFIYVRRVLRRR